MSFRKVSSMIKTQASHEFNKKREQVIHNVIRKISERNGQSFEEVLEMYMGK